MKQLDITPTKRIDYTHCVEYDGIKYMRKETQSLQHYCWQSEPEKLLDLHTISWRLLDEEHYQQNGNVEYYSCDHGWSKNEKLDKSNPIPEIEKKFKETVGKGLLYFN